MATAESVKAKLQGLIDKANSATGESDTTLTVAVDRLIDGYGKGGTSVAWDYAVLEETTFDGTNSIDTGLQLGLEDRDMSYFVEYQADSDCTVNSGVVFSQGVASPYQGTGVYWTSETAAKFRVNDTAVNIEGVDGMAKLRAVYVRDKANGTMKYYVSDGKVTKSLTTEVEEIATYEKPLYLGARYGTTYFFKGKIFRFGYIDRKLTESEIAGLMYEGTSFEEAQATTTIEENEE